MIVVLSSEAEEDFERVGDDIAEHNPTRADSFIDELVARCFRLAEMPLRFAVLGRFQHSNIRRMPHGNYLVFYRVMDERIDILHILNGAQDYEAILFPDE